MVQVSIEVTAMTPSLYSSEDPPLFHRSRHFYVHTAGTTFFAYLRYSIIGKSKDLHALREACLATQVENRTLTELAEQLVRAKNDACWQILAKAMFFERWCQWNWSHTYMHICTYICT